MVFFFKKDEQFDHFKTDFVSVWFAFSTVHVSWLTKMKQRHFLKQFSIKWNLFRTWSRKFQNKTPVGFSSTIRSVFICMISPLCWIIKQQEWNNRVSNEKGSYHKRLIGFNVKKKKGKAWKTSPCHILGKMFSSLINTFFKIWWFRSE